MADFADQMRCVLRRELTAVNQQFIHILTLRAWNQNSLASRIVEVDNVDVATSMKIIDFLVERGVALNLPSESFRPGRTLAEILSAEADMEASIEPLVEAAPIDDPAAQSLVDEVKAPRAAYRAWLQEAQDRDIPQPDEPPPNYPETAELFAHLVVMLEQFMAHAFIHWHRGGQEDADICWAASGEAMMLATAMDKRFAALGTTPTPAKDMPAMAIAEDPALIYASDRQLAESCAGAARRATADSQDPKIAKLCSKVADYADLLAAWKPGEPHPAVGRNKIFASFQGTYEKFVKPPVS